MTVRARIPRKLNRTGRGAIGAILVLLLAAPAAVAQEDGIPQAETAPAAYGGVQFYSTPVISGLQCRALCGRVALATGATRAVSVREKGVLRIRGRRFGDVSEVLFLGRPGRSDNMGVRPTTVTSSWIELKLPVGAPSGRLVLLDPNGHSSRPSRPAVRVLLDPNAQSNVGFIWPVRGMITGVFGENRGDHMHAGVDIALPAGRPIKAAASGVVVLTGPQGGYGNFTCLRHARYVTCYAHQSQMLVRYGQQVRQGDVIGRVGCTGNCTGDHLHFEVRQGPNPWSRPMNPLTFLPRR